MKHTLVLRTVLIFLACSSGTVMASPVLPVFPQSPYANVSSYGATQNQTTFNTHYIYGTLTDSSGGAPVSVGVTNNCTTCVYSGATAAYGTAHAAGGGDMGVSSSIIAPDNTAANPYTDPVYGESDAAFGNSLVVQSAVDANGNPILANNAPVQLALTMRFDGNMDLYASDLQKASNPTFGGYVSSSDVSGDFKLYDPNVTNTYGETAGIPINLIDFSAGASGVNASKFDSAKLRYVPIQNAGYSWSLTSNAGDNLSNNWSYSCDGFTQTCASSSSAPGTAFYSNSPLGFNFDTGLLTATLDTYIGATLNWDASMYVFNQAYGPTAHSRSDFSHTLGVNLNPITANVNLNFSQAQIPLSTPTQVPEPPTIDLLALALLMLGIGYERHRQHA